MKYYKNSKDEIYAYNDDAGEEYIKDGLTEISKKEVDKILTSQIDKKTDDLAELEAQIKEAEDDIRRAILIGNDSVLPELREEYRELLAQKQALEKGKNKDEKEN